MHELDDDLLVAIHEAGHAVIGTRSGFPIRYVTLTSRTPGSAAHVKHANYAVAASTWDLMASAAAGPIAQDIASECCDRVFIADGAGNDLWHVRDNARYTRDGWRSGHEPSRGLSRKATVRQIAATAWVDAHQRVVADWGAIVAVADALLTSRRALTGPQIRRLVANAAPMTPPPRAHLAGKFWPPGFQPAGWWGPESRTAPPLAVTFAAPSGAGR